MQGNSIRWVLFDLGGVLVEIGGVVATITEALGPDSTEDPWEAWLKSPAVWDWETGVTSNEEFAARLVTELNLTASPEEFLADCSTWVLGTFKGIPQLLDDLRGRVGLACLSNTNPLHWPIIQDRLRLHEALDRCFLSYQIGRGKPDPATFLHVVGELGCAPGEVLFIDDNRLNVDGARRAGLRAEQAFGGEAVRRVLEEAGLTKTIQPAARK
jgi:HAD superfamily hydrolase (TIGR01509 family)